MKGTHDTGGPGHDDTEREVDRVELDSRAMLDTLLDPVARLRPCRAADGSIVDFTLVHANAAAQLHHGRSSEDLVGQALFEPRSRQRAFVPFDTFVAAVESGEALQVDDFAVDVGPGRGVRHFDFRGSVIGGDLVVTWRDITDQVRAAEMLQESESRYRLLAEHAADVVILGDNEGVVRWVSPAIESAWGYSPASFIGRTVREFIHPDDLAALAWVNGAILRGEVCSFDARVRRADGVYEWMSNHLSPTFAADGSVSGRVDSWRNAAKEYATRQALEASEEKYRLIAENASDVIGQLDVDGSLLWASHAITTLYDWDPSNLPRLTLADFLLPEELPRAVEMLGEILEHREERTVQLHTVSGRGVQRWMSVRARPVLNDAGEIESIVVALRDVDSEVKAREQLEASEEHLRRIVENVQDIVMMSDESRRITWISPSVTRVLGWREEQLKGTKLIDLLHPDDAVRVAEVRERLYDPTPPRSHLEHELLRFRRHDGHYRWLSASGTPIVGLDGRFVSLVTTLSDVDVLVHTTEELAEQRLRLQVTLNSLLDPHVILSAVRDDADQIVDFTFAEANRAACDYLQRPLEQLVGARLRDLMPGVAASGMLALYAGAVDSGEPLILNDSEYQFDRQGTKRYFDVRGIKVGDGLSFTWRDVSERHAFESELNELATRDPLTGLVNRSELLDRIRHEAEAARSDGLSVAVALIDLDHFKDVNDTLGHEAGDDLLKSVARRLEGAVKQGDVVARLGGDEFVVLMRAIDDPLDAVQCVDRVLSALRQPFKVRGNTFFSSGSAGIAMSAAMPLPDDSEGRVLLREADTALYDAKAAGRDRWALFSERLRTEVAGRVAVISDLRSAMTNDEFTVWYQPEVDLRTGSVHAVEALLRWNHPDGEVWPADRFIALAEDSGLLLDMGARVLRQTFREAAGIVALRPLDPVIVRINLSAAQLSSGDLLAQVDHALETTGADARHLCIEITESAILRDLPQVQGNLDALNDRGFSIAIDDFGVGYASLAYLRDFRCQLIKIDRSFLGASDDFHRSRRLIRAVVALAGEFGIDVTANGVETEEQAEFLSGIGCHRAQGYLFAPAVPIPTLAPLLARGFTRSESRPRPVE